MKKLSFIIILLSLTFSCAENSLLNSSSDEGNKSNKIKDTEQTKSRNKSKTEDLVTSIDRKNNKKNECSRIEIDDRIVVTNQTFPFDYEPFRGSCFVTTFDPKYPKLPSAIELALYKNGEKLYTFDSRFNPDSVNCTVDAVSFKDLNDDNLQDIVVVGKCVAKSTDMLANEVFINTGKKTFATETSSNDKLEEFKTVKEIAEFVKKNEKLFSK